MREHEFILNYARTDPIPADIPEKLNWKYILEQARYHNVAPLLYYNLKNLPVPSYFLKELERIYTYTAFHNMQYLEELQKILERIDAIVLKGPVLATDVYGNIGLRPFSDLDLLIKRKELDNAIKELSGLGYKAKNKNFYKKYHFLMPLKKQGKIPVDIDLQWSFVDRFILNKINTDNICDESKNNRLQPDINILYLLLHIEKHAIFNKLIYNKDNPIDWIFKNPYNNRLIWFTDLYEIIKYSRGKPRSILQRSSTAKHVLREESDALSSPQQATGYSCAVIKKHNINIKELLALAEEWCIQNIVYYNLYILNKLYPIKGLENLPQPKLSMPKRLIYSIAQKKAEFSVHADIHLRPIRVVDLVNYLFPPKKILKKYYCRRNPITAIIIHLFLGLKNISIQFIGICKGTLFTKEKKESKSAD